MSEEHIGDAADVLVALALGFSYSKRPTRPALSNCSFSLSRGSITGLVGANGAGKSTLIKILARILRPGEGDVTVGGRDLHEPGSRNKYNKVSLVAQDRPLYRYLSVGEMLRVAKSLNSHWNPDRAHAWLSRFDIPLDSKCGQLSGGQQAQVALALAVGSSPAVLLLDEPVASLDPIARNEVTTQLVSEAKEHGTTILVSSHVVAELASLVTDLLVLKSGQLILQGNTNDIRTSHVRMQLPMSVPSSNVITEVHRFEHDDSAIVRVNSPSTLDGLSDERKVRPLTLEEIVLAYLSSSIPVQRTAGSAEAGAK
ncbi:ABC transporter ATP-binding protein [Amycolatopsis sp. NPDC005232]|uniref:ABC transporter ATP-binding protein n=1 Tax=Amycolatopsis sp. NPDC005232 TaxID=3157027 RepID=UPI0033AC1BD8